ncbi:MAG: zf-HC2 domain-containing protein [Oscillospiraceae bacterium]|nr:zf-HC2 domain-containing protein [Oscillospiraceae bacterium]
MKCEVIRDLLPLYDEELCSPESAALVEEHIKTCAACRSLIEDLSKTEPPKATLSEIKPFVKVKHKLRARIIGLITLGVVLLAVLIPVGYLTVNQIFHIKGGTDFEDLIYKHEARQFAEMLADGRMEEFVGLLDDTRFINASDGYSVGHKEFYLERLKAAYENVKKYDPRVGEVFSKYYRHRKDDWWREQYFYLYFTRPDGSVFPVMMGRHINDNTDAHGIPKVIPVEISKLYGSDPEKNWYEYYSDMEDYSPDDLREICAFINTLYLADGGDFEIKMIEKIMLKPTSDAYPEEHIDHIGHLIAIRFDVSDYKAVYNGIVDLKRSNYTLDVAIGVEQLDKEREMLYYPVKLTGSDGEREAVVSIKLYFDEFGLHSPRPEDIRGITGDSDLEKKLAGIFG